MLPSALNLDLDVRFGTWNVRRLFKVGAIKSVVGELEKYKLDLVEVQEFRWEGEGYQTADQLHIFLWKRECFRDRIFHI
jgi:hypothetical protein